MADFYRYNRRKFREIILLQCPKTPYFKLIFVPADPRIIARTAKYSPELDPFRVIMDFEKKCLDGTFEMSNSKMNYKSGPLEGEIKRYVVPEYATNENKKS